MLELMALAQQCAPNVAPQTLTAIARVESAFNPYAIGVVGGAVRQPKSKTEALATVRQLLEQGRNFSVGLVQVNRYNLPKYGLTYEQAFDTCQNLRVGGLILAECYGRAMPAQGDEQRALRAAFSCYYSGNFKRGFRPDAPGGLSYVDKVLVAANKRDPAMLRVPRISDATPAGELVQRAPAPQRVPSESVLLNRGDQRSTAISGDAELQSIAVTEISGAYEKLRPVHRDGANAAVERGDGQKVVF